MKKKIILLTVPILLFVAILYGFIPYYEKYKNIQRYAFTMDSADGKFSLSDLKNRYAIIYFGYMSCPDICPTTLSFISQALNRLKKRDAKKFQLIFISVDPDRDTLKGIKEYVRFFSPNAIGLTSNKKYLKKVTSNYGTYYAKEYQKGSKLDYSVAHTSFVYIMDTDGLLIKKLPHLEDSNQIYKVLLSLSK